jgi:hypothetical protein
MPWKDPDANRKHCRERNRRYRAEQKIVTLSHYGKDGKLQCCWPGCDIDDIDLLTLDHVENDGAAQRKAMQVQPGTQTYVKLKRAGYPDGYQTLCWNHQWKKVILWHQSHWMK